MEKQDNINNTNDKPVGYGSSIQSSGHGNKSRPKKQEAVKGEIVEEKKTRKNEN